MLTADTITDEQIRELRLLMREEQTYERWPDGAGSMMNVADLALQRSWSVADLALQRSWSVADLALQRSWSVADLALQRSWSGETRSNGVSARFPTPSAIRAARARCAEILNARAKESK